MPSTIIAARPASRPIAQRLPLAIGSIALGVLLIWFAGFSPMGKVHNATHDARHSAAFPCH